MGTEAPGQVRAKIQHVTRVAQSTGSRLDRCQHFDPSSSVPRLMSRLVKKIERSGECKFFPDISKKIKLNFITIVLFV